MYDKHYINNANIMKDNDVYIWCVNNYAFEKEEDYNSEWIYCVCVCVCISVVTDSYIIIISSSSILLFYYYYYYY